MPLSAHHRGLSFAAVSAGSYGVVTTCAAIAYAGGTNPLTLVSFRATLGLGAALALVILVSRRYTLPRRAWGSFLLMTLGVIMINYGYMSSVKFIPVGLAALVFFTFPILILAITAIRSRQLPPPVSAFAFLLAFAGLALALGPSLGGLDWRGLLGAATASLGAVLMIWYSAAVVRHTSVGAMTLYAHVVIVPITLIVLGVFGGPSFPETTVAWTGLVLAGLGYLFGTVFQFLAVRYAEPAPTALVFNLEPIISIAVAAAFLGERLLGNQYAGGAMVLIGVFLATLKAVDPAGRTPASSG